MRVCLAALSAAQGFAMSGRYCHEYEKIEDNFVLSLVSSRLARQHVQVLIASYLDLGCMGCF